GRGERQGRKEGGETRGQARGEVPDRHGGGRQRTGPGRGRCGLRSREPHPEPHPPPGPRRSVGGRGPSRRARGARRSPPAGTPGPPRATRRTGSERPAGRGPRPLAGPGRCSFAFALRGRGGPALLPRRKRSLRGESQSETVEVAPPARRLSTRDLST